MPTEINWALLSSRGAAILRQVMAPLAMGYSERQVARRLETSRRSVLSLVAELREELARLAGS